ncbi:TPA: hypothetical protein EYP13_00430, partial [Candidatus Micrarchaeota archaeon]|nr:hypothetical protein [Candidatus Micrarchaeota archaeon]
MHVNLLRWREIYSFRGSARRYYWGSEYVEFSLLRCFVAVDLATSEVVERVSVLENELSKLDAKMTFTKPALIHVTLKFLGEIPELLAKRVAESLEEISFSPFSVELKGVGAF